MSFRATRLADSKAIEQFTWIPVAGSPSPPPVQTGTSSSTGVSDAEQRIAEVELASFNKGYAEGERAGADAATARSAALVRRVVQTIEELTAVRAEVIRRTERQTVQLVLALAERVVQREITLDRTILVGMVRAALDRLGELGSATIRLHPDDYNVLSLSQPAEGRQVQIIADSAVSPGGCSVQADYGFMDISPDSQFRELARALLSDDDAPSAAANAHHGLVIT